MESLSIKLFNNFCNNIVKHPLFSQGVFFFIRGCIHEPPLGDGFSKDGHTFETKSFLIRSNYHMRASRYICLCKRQVAEPVLSKYRVQMA